MLTEANVEAHSFRLEFARELLQSMAKRKAARAELVDSAAAPAASRQSQRSLNTRNILRSVSAANNVGDKDP